MSGSARPVSRRSGPRPTVNLEMGSTMTETPAPSPLETTCQQVHSRRQAGEDFVLLDCREEAEFATARLDESVLFPMSTLAERAQDLTEYRDRQIVVFCHHGGRSLRVAMWLRQQGFRDAQSMAGGIDEWSQTIDPGIPRY